MFGRRKAPPGETATPAPTPPIEPYPIDKMDDALIAAIRLFTKVLDDAGIDSGALALRDAPVPSDVSALIAHCTTYRDVAE